MSLFGRSMPAVLLCVAALMVPTPAVMAAQGQKILIKNKDGSVTEFVIPEDAQGKAVAAPPPERRVMPEPQPVRAPLPMPRAEKVLSEPVPAPAAQPAATKATPSPVRAKAAKAEPRRTGVPIPGRKPLLQPMVMETAATLAPDEAIPESMAKAIAIRHAPPASDFKVLRRMHEGVPVYAVVFKTEDGSHVVIIDARTGDVIAD